MNQNICRVCLKKGMLSTIFSDDKCAPYFMIMECTSVKIAKEDTLPSLICQDCLNNLKIAFQFKRLCETSDYQLRKAYGNMNNPPDRMVSHWKEGFVEDPRENKYVYNNYYERPHHTQVYVSEHTDYVPSGANFKTERMNMENRLPEPVASTIHMNAPTTLNTKPNNLENKSTKSGDKQTKKKTRNPHTWKSNVRKERREKGLEYADVNNKIHPPRSIKSGCGPHCRHNCMKKFSPENRKAIFDHFYQLSDDRKTLFFHKFTSRETPVRKRTLAEKSRKSYVFKYSLMLNNIKQQVCKTFFCNTLDVSQSRIYYFHDKVLDNDTMIPRTSMKGKNTKKVTPKADLDVIRAHINSFPIVDTHYCRKVPGKSYLEPTLSLEKMYNLYREQTEKPVSKYVYRNIFKKEFNIGFQKPKKDRCDACEKLKFPTRNPPYFNLPPVKAQENITTETANVRDVKEEVAMVDLANTKLFHENLKTPSESVSNAGIPKISNEDNERKKSKTLKKKISSVAKPKKLKVPEKCLECGKEFNYTGYLDAHIRTHSGEKPYVCKICKKGFTQVGNLVLHTRIHTGEKPFQCEICSKQFCTSSNLTVHRKTHMQDDRTYECSQCSKVFKSLKLLESHIGTHTGVKNHVCKLCGKRFYKTTYLTTHINTVHAGEKKYKCIRCGKEFSNSSNLTAHVRIHTGEQPFVCELCNARFNQSSSLQRHKKHHAKIDSKKNAQKSQTHKISKNSYASHNYYDQAMTSSGGNSTSHPDSKQHVAMFNPVKPYTESYSQYLKHHDTAKHSSKKQFIHCKLELQDTLQ